MDTDTISRSIGALRNFAATPKLVERCELCSVELGGQHPHLLEPVHRKIICACEACSILFTAGGETKYKRVPRRVRFLSGFRLTEGQWESLMIPINMAFFFNSTPDQRVVVLYPSPAGPIESLLPLDAWEDIVRENPPLTRMESDVEALLVNRVGDTHEYFVAPIDECYKLVGIIRSRWRGLSGGSEVWHEIVGFFSRLKDKACLN